MGGSLSHESIIDNVPLKGTKEKGFSEIYRNPVTVRELRSTPNPSINSVKDAIYTAF